LVAVTLCPHDELAHALVHAKKRGVTVQVAIDPGDAGNDHSGQIFKAEDSLWVVWASVASGRKDAGLMQKFAIIDRASIFGSTWFPRTVRTRICCFPRCQTNWLKSAARPFSSLGRRPHGPKPMSLPFLPRLSRACSYVLYQRWNPPSADVSALLSPAKPTDNRPQVIRPPGAFVLSPPALDEKCDPYLSLVTLRKSALSGQARIREYGLS
jgi:hypothetical protein